jgi:hypothetical protein
MRIGLALVLVLAAGLVASGHRVGSAGVTVRLPPGWHSVKRLGGLDPKERLVVSSKALPLRGSPCQIAYYAPRRDAVSIVVVEWKPRPDVRLPPRPRRITRSVLGLRRGEIECFGGYGGGVQFREHERNLGVYVMVGLRAPSPLVGRTLAVLSTLRVARRR